MLEDTDDLLTRECAAVIEEVEEREDPDNPGKVFPARNKVVRFLPLG